jgi:hypothetical protein
MYGLNVPGKTASESKMEYVIGLARALAGAGAATMIGLDRERSFYPTVLIVIASYYVLFAVMGGSGQTLAIEVLVACGFSLLAMLGFKKNLWLVAAAMVGHGAFDLVHHFLLENPGVPHWCPDSAWHSMQWPEAGSQRASSCASAQALPSALQPSPTRFA